MTSQASQAQESDDADYRRAVIQGQIIYLYRCINTGGSRLRIKNPSNSSEWMSIKDACIPACNII